MYVDFYLLNKANTPAVKSINDEANTYEFVGKSYYKAPEKVFIYVLTKVHF